MKPLRLSLLAMVFLLSFTSCTTEDVVPEIIEDYTIDLNLAKETNSTPKWNFWKYLIDKDGKVVKSYSMVTNPNGNKLISMIDKLLSE